MSGSHVTNGLVIEVIFVVASSGNVCCSHRFMMVVFSHALQGDNSHMSITESSAEVMHRLVVSYIKL